MPKLSDFKIKESIPPSFKVIHYSPWDELPDVDESEKVSDIPMTPIEQKGVQKGFRKKDC